MFLLVSILTETYPLVTYPVSTRWSPTGLLSGAVLMINGSLSALTQFPVPVAIGDFDGRFCGSAFLGVGPIGF